jgi:hypothetical protein
MQKYSSRPMDSRAACYSVTHNAIIPSFLSFAIVGLALVFGAFALRGCYIVGLPAQHQLVHQDP